VTYQNGDGSKQVSEQHDLHATLEGKCENTRPMFSSNSVCRRSKPGLQLECRRSDSRGGKEETDMIRMAVRGSGWGAPRGRSVPGGRGEVCTVWSSVE
jgi:hypothetical protein